MNISMHFLYSMLKLEYSKRLSGKENKNDQNEVEFILYKIDSRFESN